MSTQAQLHTALDAALSAAGYTPAPSADPEAWPSWAVGQWVLALLPSSETGGAFGTGSGVADITPIDVVLTMLVGNPFDSSAGQRASMTAARALRVLGEAIGDSVAARLTYDGDSRDEVEGGIWLVRVRFNVRQYDTY